MNEKVISAIVGVLVAIVGLAGLAVLVSKASQTSSVFNASSTGLANALCTAMSPVTGASCGGRGLIDNVTSTITFGS